MAAPAEATILNLNGSWLMDKTDSADPDEIFKLQGMSWLTRKAISIASVTLKFTQTTVDGVVHVNVDQVLTGGIKGTTETRTLDWAESPHQDHIFGSVIGQNRFVKAAPGPDGKSRPAVEVQTRVGGAEDESVAKFLRGEILENGDVTEGFLVDEQNENFLQSWVRSQDSGWTGEQIWGFETVNGVRRHTRRIVVAKDDKCVKARMVYTYLGPRE
ncbi:hypothetical protein FQN55_003920 [Onygenales sp. PD_40]|nr:hypothetical protein FQN55_003920 [Onygenales sp. PD_40]KAK2776323.1 hypothetical protein FQN53_002724 [Emmonsiellopsis sp. PD_33]KAK2788247.1 hypothetical protein FQN52_006787 [Onygenales sp. PD_12]